MKKKWIIWASIFTVFLVAIYLILHLCFSKLSGSENIYLQDDQILVINSIIIQQVDSVKLQVDSSKVAATNKTTVSSAKNVATPTVNKAKIKATPQLSDEYKRSLISNYIRKTINHVDTAEVNGLLKAYTINQLITVLPQYPFRVKSFFWLIGNKVILEVVFWSLFGLIAALMFSVTSVRNFNEQMIFEHIGKVFYTPLICVAIYLSLNALINSGSISLVGVGKGVLVLSFILGFFTRRSILLLVKIKDLILPKTPDVIEADNAIRNKYPNEIKGKVIAKDLAGDKLDQLMKTVRISAERNYTGEDKDSYFKLKENLTPDNTFSFNSLKSGIYNIKCTGTLDLDEYECNLNIPMQDSDVPVWIDVVLEKVKKEGAPDVKSSTINRVVIPINISGENGEILIEFKKKAEE